MYAELSYFDGYRFAHVAAWEEHRRLGRRRAEAIKVLDRRGSRR